MHNRRTVRRSEALWVGWVERSEPHRKRSTNDQIPMTNNGGARCARPTLRLRRGVSLLEVLIAIFVVAFGLLGIAAVIPLGRITIFETAKADRCGAAGRAALREIRTRRMLDPFSAHPNDPQGWVDPQGRSVIDLVYSDPSFSGLSGFCLDPLLLATVGAPGMVEESTAKNLLLFPSMSVIQKAVGNSYNEVAMRRMSLNCVTGTFGNRRIPVPDLANRIFSWHDDWVLDTPAMQERPRQMFTFNTGQVRELPYRTGALTPALADTTFPLVRETDANYTWMATISPNMGEIAAAMVAATNTRSAQAFASTLRSYVVSAVVYYRRNLREPTANDETPTERVLRVQRAVLGKGMGGGNLLLTLDAALSEDQKEKWLNIAPGDWLLLCGRHRVKAASGAEYSYPLQAWYRVLSASTAFAGPDSRAVTVTGPDWEVPVAQTDLLMAVLPTNVVGVYTTVVDLDMSTLLRK